jgi:hypothetical protein
VCSSRCYVLYVRFVLVRGLLTFDGEGPQPSPWPNSRSASAKVAKYVVTNRLYYCTYIFTNVAAGCIIPQLGGLRIRDPCLSPCTCISVLRTVDNMQHIDGLLSVLAWCSTSCLTLTFVTTADQSLQLRST